MSLSRSMRRKGRKTGVGVVTEWMKMMREIIIETGYDPRNVPLQQFNCEVCGTKQFMLVWEKGSYSLGGCKCGVDTVKRFIDMVGHSETMVGKS